MKPVFNVSEVAQSRGWQPDQVKDLFTRYGIPPKAADRSDADWQRLEKLLAASPPSPGEAQPPEPPTYQRGEPIEVYFPHRGEWWGGYQYLEPHKNPERCWLTDSQGTEHSSQLEFVRKVIR